MTCNYLLKCIIIGDTSVGKSCLMQSFLDENIRTEHQPTVGVEFGAKVVNIDGERVRLQIWDTAGSEQYRSVTRSYYRASAIALLVYDITRKQTFDHLGQWLDEARINGNPYISAVVVGNKVDLFGQREVSLEDAQKWAKDKGCLFIETSAKFRQGVDEAFINPCKEVMEKISTDVIGLENQAFGVTVKKKIQPVEVPKKKCCG